MRAPGAIGEGDPNDRRRIRRMPTDWRSACLVLCVLKERANRAKATASGGAGRQAECVLHGSSLGIRDSPGAPSPTATHCGLFGNPHQQRQHEQLNGQVPQIKRGVALVFADPGASFEMYLKNAFQVFMEGNYYDQSSRLRFRRPEAQHPG
jgi:hypothetical protein